MKGGRRYRYYVEAAQENGSAAFRISASEIERIVIRQVPSFLGRTSELVDELGATLASRLPCLSWPVPIVTAETSAPAIPPVFITTVPRLLLVPMAIGTIALKVARPRFRSLNDGQRGHRGDRSQNELTCGHFSCSMDCCGRNIPLPYLSCTPAEYAASAKLLVLSAPMKLFDNAH